jgi:Fe-S-cluster-containing hydrogenase component 2
VCPVQAISFEDDVPRRFISMCIGAKSTHPCQPPP